MACKTCGGMASVRPISEREFDMNSTARLTVKRFQTPFTVTIPAALAVDSGTPRSFIVDQESFEIPAPAARWLYDNYPGAYAIEEFNTIDLIIETDADTNRVVMTVTANHELMKGIDEAVKQAFQALEDEMFDNEQSVPVVSVATEPVVEMFVNEQPAKTGKRGKAK